MKASPEVTGLPGRSSKSIGNCGLAWQLPVDASCARQARTLLADTLGRLGLERDIVADARLMVSELATNAHLHAAGHGPHELWIHGEAGELLCAVFDGFAEAVLPAYSWTSGDHGRGLGVVAELSGGRWGSMPARSHAGRRPGKAVWFAVPAPRPVAERLGRCAVPAGR